MSATDDAERVFRMIESGATAVAPMMPAGIAELIAAGLGAAAGLVADLIAAGLHPVAAIERIRTAVPDFDAATRELEDYARSRGGKDT